MTILIKYWCDSGANIHSKYEGEITVDEQGFTDEEWQALSEDEKEEIMKESAFERLDWGWKEIKSE
jgi:hypothetical protein